MINHKHTNNRQNNDHDHHDDNDHNYRRTLTKQQGTLPRDVGKTLGEASINEIARSTPYDVSPTVGK